MGGREAGDISVTDTLVAFATAGGDVHVGEEDELDEIDELAEWE